ncbi:MAG: alpha/beta hydrolase [Balneolales bacterium]|nr:alpha/beta hydrolase [Balneolales bacterium]
MKKTTEIQTFTIDVGQLAVRILRIGQPESPPVFFLHGWGCSAETMLSPAKSIAGHRCCYLFDFPGFGKTEPPPQAWDVGSYAKLTHEIITKLLGDSEDKADVVAHSFGGRVMLKLLSNRQLSGMYGKILITGGAGMKPKRSWKYYYKVSLAKVLKFPFLLLPASLSEKGLVHLRKTAIWKSLGSSEYSTLQGVMREVFVKTVREYLEDTMSSISHEILLVWGEDDDATPLYQAKRMEKGIEGAVLVTLPNAGHYAFLDQPAQFNAVLLAYLQGK